MGAPSIAALSALGLVACATTMGPYTGNASAHAGLEAPHSRLRLVVLPVADGRTGSSGNDETGGLVLVPLVPFASSVYHRPEHRALGPRSYPAFLTEALHDALLDCNLFDSVRLETAPSPGTFDLVLQAEIHGTEERQLYTTYGLSVDGALLWLLGLPVGFTEVELDLEAAVAKADGNLALRHRDRVALRRWYSVWWGPRPAEAHEMAVRGWLAGLCAALEPLATAGESQ